MTIDQLAHIFVFGLFRFHLIGHANKGVGLGSWADGDWQQNEQSFIMAKTVNVDARIPLIDNNVVGLVTLQMGNL